MSGAGLEEELRQVFEFLAGAAAVAKAQKP
jgi:hypothetical protein